MLKLSNKLLLQNRNDKDKIYSIHEPSVKESFIVRAFSLEKIRTMDI